jgi:hypothetical protein
MSCGCQTPVIQIPVAQTCAEAQAQSSLGPCESFKGKFYDKSIEPFVFPKVGNIGSLMVCEASLWSTHQFVGIAIGNSQYAFLRIVGTGQNALKVLNGFVKDDSSKDIAGNPEPGTVIPQGSVLFPSPPMGGSEQLQLQFMQMLETYGSNGVIKILKESSDISFINTEELDTDVDYRGAYIFGGDWITNALRKIKKIFTGQGGRTLCFPDVGTTTDENVVVDGTPVKKYLAYFDEKKCLKRGKEVKQAISNHRLYDIRSVNITNALNTPITVVWSNLNLPEPINNRSLFADLELSVVGGGGVSGATMTISLDGVNYLVIWIEPNKGEMVSRRVLMPVNPSGSFVYQCTTSGTIQNHDGRIVLNGFYV